MFPAPYGAYATADGHIALSLCQLAPLAEALEEPALAAFPEEDAYSRREEIIPLVARALLKRRTAEWEDILSKARLWYAPVQDYAAVERDPQVAWLGSFETLPGATDTPITLVKHPVRYNGEVSPVRLPPQPLGAQTAEVLRELGFAEGEIDDMAAKGVIGVGARPE